jgi:hypothetical protein
MWVLIVSWFAINVTTFQVQFATKQQCEAARLTYMEKIEEARSVTPPAGPNGVSLQPARAATYPSLSVCVNTGLPVDSD